jgi:oxygen-independent coproporphyrinogen-3 oxidase
MRGACDLAPFNEVSAAAAASAATVGIWRARSGLGGSHTVVTYPPLNALEPMEGEEPFQIDAKSPVHLYFHVAFCEFICAFCHYQRTFTDPRRQAPAVEPYVEALGREIDRRRDALADAPIQSVYLGGGTPTALDYPTLERLLSHIRRLVDLRETHFSFETSPKTVVEPDGAAKLALLVSSGARRVSMGVQTFDETILRQQRGHGRAELDAAIEAVLELGITVNLDLIQDLPLQGAEHIEEDLANIAKIRPAQVTWYTLRAQKGSTIGKLEGSGTAREAALFSSIADGKASVSRRLRIISAMRELGYRPRPGGRFLRDADREDIFKSVRNGLAANLLGFGISSYSHGWGYFFRNLADRRVSHVISEYISRMRAGRSPVGSLMKLSSLERAASEMVQAARTFIPFELLDRDDATGWAWRTAAERCVEAGLLGREAHGLRLTELGLAVEEEVSSLFYSAPVREKLASHGEYWAGPEWFDPPAKRAVARIAGAAN